MEIIQFMKDWDDNVKVMLGMGGAGGDGGGSGVGSEHAMNATPHFEDGLNPQREQESAPQSNQSSPKTASSDDLKSKFPGTFISKGKVVQKPSPTNAVVSSKEVSECTPIVVREMVELSFKLNKKTRMPKTEEASENRSIKMSPKPSTSKAANSTPYPPDATVVLPNKRSKCAG